MQKLVAFALGGAIVGLVVGIAIGRSTMNPSPPPSPAITATAATEAKPHLLPMRTQTASGDDFALLVQMANHDMDEKKYAQAIASYEKALLRRDDGRVWTDLGVCYRHTGQSEKALAAFERAVKIDPLLWEADYNRAVLLLEAGHKDEARAIAQRLREQHPANSDIRTLHETLSRPQ